MKVTQITIKMQYFFAKVYRIFLGWYYFITNKNNEMALERLKICVECPLMKRGVCTDCGCVLQAKARIKEEKCPLDKWDLDRGNFIGSIGKQFGCTFV